MQAIRIFRSCSNFHSDAPPEDTQQAKMHLYIISHENGDLVFFFNYYYYRQGNVKRRRLTSRHRIASRDPCIRYRVGKVGTCLLD